MQTQKIEQIDACPKCGTEVILYLGKELKVNFYCWKCEKFIGERTEKKWVVRNEHA